MTEQGDKKKMQEMRMPGDTGDPDALAAMTWDDLWDGDPAQGGKLRIDPTELASWLIGNDQIGKKPEKMLLISTDSWPSFIEGLFQGIEGIRTRFYDEFQQLAPFGLYVDAEAVDALGAAYDKGRRVREAAMKAAGAHEFETGVHIPDDQVMDWFLGSELGQEIMRQIQAQDTNLDEQTPQGGVQ